MADSNNAKSQDQSKALSSALHEINNPLEALLNLLALIDADPGLSQISRDHLKTAEGEVLRVSRIAQAAMKREPNREVAQDTDVGDLLSSVFDLHRTKLDRHGVLASTRNDDDARAVIYPGQLRQLFGNLLLNAVDAMPKGGKVVAKISKSREWCGQERSGVRITLADSGTGIAANILSRVREPFFTTKGTAGSGMGLAVVQEVVEHHKGRMRIRSSTRTGRSGSVFSIFIPATERS